MTDHQTPGDPAPLRRTDRRQFLVAGGAFAGALLLGACGDSDDATTTTATTGRAPGAGPSRQTTLDYWTWSHVTNTPGVRGDPVKEAFEKAHPKIRLNVKVFAFPDYLTALRTGVPAGTAGAVIALQNGSQGRAFADYTVPLDDALEAQLGADWKDGFRTKAIDLLDTISPDGSIRGVPIFFTIAGTQWFNQELFDRVGATVPSTYDELKQVAGALRDEGIVPIAWGAKDQWPNTDYLLTYASQFHEGALEAAETGEIPFTDPSIVQALAFMQQTVEDDIYNKGPFGTTAYPEAFAMFNDGRAAMINTGTFNMAATVAARGGQERVGSFLYPHIPGAEAPSFLGSIPSGVPQSAGDRVSRPWVDDGIVLAVRDGLDPDEQAAAETFVAWMATREVAEANASWAPPARNDVPVQGITDPGFQRVMDWHYEVAEFGVRREFIYPETREALQTAIEQVCVGGEDPAKALEPVDAAASKAREQDQ